MAEEAPKPASRAPRATRLAVALALPVLAVMVILGGMLSYQWLAGYLDAKRHPPPGRLFDIGGHRLYLHCLGTAGDRPSVVFEAEPGAWSVIWRAAQAGAARLTRACVYDRAGYGASEPGPEPRDGRHIVFELNRLLVNAGLTGPVILVGHGAAGLWLRRYARRFPDATAALVLVDAVEEEVIDDYLALLAPRRRQYARLALAARFGLLRHLWRDRLPGIGLSGEAATDYRIAMRRAQSYRVTEAELSHLAEEAHTIRTMGPYRDLPLAVISARFSVRDADAAAAGLNSQALNKAWSQAQVRLTRLATDPIHMTSMSSDHWIPINEPDTVVLAIERILEKLSASGGDNAVDAR